MYTSEKSLVQDVKREVLDELRQRGYTSNLPSYGSQMYSPYTATQYQTYQTIKDSVKNEILAEIQMQQAEKTAQMYGLDRSLSDQRLQQMIDARYRSIDNLKADVKRELTAFQRLESQRSADPYVRQIAGVLAEDAQRRGIPFDHLIKSLDQKSMLGNSLTSRLSGMLNTGQRKGFLCGIGTAILLSLLLPTTRSDMRQIAVRSLEEGMSMVDKAKTFVSKDHQQNPPTDFTNFASGPPPEENKPTDGDSVKQ